MPGPAPRRSAPSGSGVESRLPGGSPASMSPGLPRRGAPGRLLSSFSVEAILAIPEPPLRAASPPPRARGVEARSVAGSAAPDSGPPWTCPAAWLPVPGSLTIRPLRPQPGVPGWSVAHLCGCPGRGVTGLELAHHPGLWGHPDWAPAEKLQDPDRHQKRIRTMFTLQQLEELEKVFAKQHNLVGKNRARLAARLHLTENQVRIWFQNRRVKYQKQQKLKLLSSSAVSAALAEPCSSSDGSLQGQDAESRVGS